MKHFTLTNFTRGGQLSLHKYQMIKQVTIVTLTLCLLTGAGSFTYMFIKNTSPYDRYLYQQYLHAEFKTSLSFSHNSTTKQSFRYFNGAEREIRSVDVLNNSIVKQTVFAIDTLSKALLEKSLWHCLWMLCALVSFFGYRGYVKSKKILERGNRIMNAKQLTKLIKKRKQASDLKLDGLPLIKDKETSHILITGTTGAGKSNCLNTLLPQIRARGDRAIIVDLTGDFQKRYQQPGDLILNPLDEHSQNWLPWVECHQESHFDQLAATLVPKSNTNDSFWENAGRALLATALKKTKDTCDIKALYHTLVQDDLANFSEFFRGTDAATYTHVDGDKMTLSIRATLANQLQCFKLLKQTEEPFSVRDWVQNKENQNWLFLTAKSDQRETLRPLISTWLDVATNALMSTEPNTGKRLWFIIDELPALQKLPSLETAMAESRKYGGCIMAGIQSFPQLNATYGQNKSQAILDLFNTKIFFRNTDPNTNDWISKVLGEAETTEQIENLSYGANTIRDGVSLSQQNKTKPLVMPTEIANLKDLEALVKLPGDFPVGRLKTSYKAIL